MPEKNPSSSAAPEPMEDDVTLENRSKTSFEEAWNRTYRDMLQVPPAELARQYGAENKD